MIETKQMLKIITQKNCSNSKSLKNWLKKEKFPCQELSIEKKETLEFLLRDPQYSANFCDIESCFAHIAAVNNPNSGEYFFTGLNGVYDVYNLQKIIKDNSSAFEAN